MKNKIKIFVLAILVFSFVGADTIKADSGPISTQTAFQFQQNGQAISQPVSFDIKCYGTSSVSNKLLKISELSEICPNYGCQFDTTSIFEAYKQNIQYCNLEGEINGNKFNINNFLAPSMKGWNCHQADFGIMTNNKYYKETQQYKDCQTNVRKEYYPQWDGNENDNLGDFSCWKYMVQVPTGECGGYGYLTINSVCYKSTSESNACVAEENRKTKLCDQYLQDVSANLAKDKSGYPFEQICEAKINIPASVSSNNQQSQNQNIKPTPRTNKQTQPKNFFNSIKCFFMSLFRKSC